MGSFSKNMALLLIGFWLGSAVLFAAVVAPTLFNPNVVSGLSPSMAGAISGAILRRIYLITYICIGTSTFFLIMASLGEKDARGPRRALLLCILILGLNALSDLWILDRMNKVKLAKANAPFSEIGSLQKEFDRWHQISLWVYGGTILLGGLSAILLLPSVSGGRSKKSSK